MKKTNKTKRIMATIRIQRQAYVQVIFYGLPMQLLHKLVLYDVNSRVTVVTNIIQNWLEVVFFLNATSATHFYFDHQCEASAKYLKGWQPETRALPQLQQNLKR